MPRLLQYSASLCLASAALFGAVPPASAHVGHGDEFQQQGDVRQVKANADTDALLGVMTEKPQQEPQGLTVPTAAVVEAEGKPLVFVKSGSTYDPVFVQTDATSGDRITVTNGLSAGEDVVVQGALSLYAESKKSQQSEPTPPADGAAPAPAVQPKFPAVGAAVVGVLALGGVAASRLGRRSD